MGFCSPGAPLLLCEEVAENTLYNIHNIVYLPYVSNISAQKKKKEKDPRLLSAEKNDHGQKRYQEKAQKRTGAFGGVTFV